MSKTVRACAVSAVFFLAACSGEDGSEEAQIDYASFDDAALSQMFDEGQYAEVVAIVREQRNLGIADKTDYLLAAAIHILQSDPIAATVSLERAKDSGAEAKEIVLFMAKAHVQKGEYKDAAQLLGDSELQETDKFEANLLQGDIYKQLGQPELAQKYFSDAVALQPDDFRGYLGLALLDLSQGRIESAEQYALQAEELNPDDPIVFYIRGTSARYRGEVDLAKELLKKAITLHDEHVMAHLELASVLIDERSLEDAEKELDAVYAIAPEHSLAFYYSALLLAEKGQDEEAEKLLLRMGDVVRGYPPALRVYGHVAYKLEKYTTARPYLEAFLALVPGDRPTRLALAESLNRRGESRMALDYLEPLLGGESEDVEAMMQAASAYGMLGEINKSRDVLRAVQSLRGQVDISGARLRQLGRRLAFANFLSGDVRSAVGQLEAMIREEPSDFMSQTLLANLQVKSGDFAAAELIAADMIEAAPSSPVGHNVLSTIHYAKREFEQALDTVNRSLALNSKYASALKNKGLVLIALEKSEEAIPVLKELKAITPNDAQVDGMLGRVYLMEEDPNAALLYLRKAEEGLPDSAIIKLDYSVAMANKNLLPSAISKAEEALRKAGSDEKLAEFINEQIAAWESQLKEQQAAERALEEEKRKEILAQKEKFEAKLKEAEQQRQKVRDLRNELFAVWVVTVLLGQDEAQIPDYLAAVRAADQQFAGDEDIIRKVKADLEAAEVELTAYEIEKSLRDHMVIARQRLQDEADDAEELESPS